MNIAIFSDSYLPTKSGVVTVIIQLREQLIKLGHNVILVTVETTDEYETYDPDIYRVHSVPLGLGTDQFLGVPAMHPLIHFLKEKNIDIIHCHTEFGIGKAGLRAARILKVPAVCTTHTMWADFYKYYLPLGKIIPPVVIDKILKKYYGKFSSLIGVSTKARNYFKKENILPDQPSVVIPNAIDQSKFIAKHSSEEEKKALRSKYNINDDDILLIFVGRIGQEKRVEELLEVAKKVTQRNSRIKMMFVGDGPDLKNLKERASKEIADGSIIFAGFIEWVKVHIYYESADIFVTSSLSEMHSMTILEAQLSSLPLVVRKDESYFDSIIENKNGFLCDSEDEMVEKILLLSEDKEKRKTFGQNSLEITKNFSIETHVSRTLKVYEEVIKAYPNKINDKEVMQMTSIM